MRKDVNFENIAQKRLLNIKEVCVYIGQGQNRAREYMDKIGATRRFGSRVLFDKQIIDKTLDTINS